MQTMTDTQVLLQKITALRQRLEQAQGTTREITSAFAREGWDWTTRSIRSEFTSATDPATERTGVRLSYTGADGEASGSYHAVIEPTGVILHGLGSCGDEQPRQQRQFTVSHIEKRELDRPSHADIVALDPGVKRDDR